MANLVLNGKSIDTIDEIAENFIVDEALAAVCDGTLVAWLEEFGYDEEFVKFKAIPSGLDNGTLVSCVIDALGLNEGECLAANKRNTDKRKEERETNARAQERIKAERQGIEADQKAESESRQVHERSSSGMRQELPDIETVCNFDTVAEGFDAIEAKVLKIYQEPANQGIIKAQLALGVYYRDYAFDERKAVSWFLKAAEQGDAEAQRNLGNCYYSGTGVSQNYEEAVKWYRKAAEQGDAEARVILGVRYELGEGVRQNAQMGPALFRKPARQARLPYGLRSFYPAALGRAGLRGGKAACAQRDPRHLRRFRAAGHGKAQELLYGAGDGQRL